MSESDVYRRQILTYKDGPRIERVLFGVLFLMVNLMIFICDFVLCGAKANIMNCSLVKLILFDIHSEVLIRANMGRLTNVGLMLGQRRRR